MLPLYLLTNKQTKMWITMPGVRRVIASELVRRYPTGCGVLAWRGLKHIANIDPQGRVHELPPPFRQYQRSQIANKPRAVECACADLEHPEYGEWRNHPDYAKGIHHPFCEFDPTSPQVYREVFLKRTGGQTDFDPDVGKVRVIPIRPDEYDRTREKAQGKRGEKTGARES